MSDEWVMVEVPNGARDLLLGDALAVDAHRPEAEGCVSPILNKVGAAWQGETPEKEEFLSAIVNIKYRFGNLNSEVSDAIMDLRASEPETMWKLVEA